MYNLITTVAVCRAVRSVENKQLTANWSGRTCALCAIVHEHLRTPMELG